jgi:hypothetical protein
MRRLLFASLLVISGCISLDDFPSQSTITGPRILAVITEPPEVTPGKSLSVSTLVADADDVEVEYRVCGNFDATINGGAQFGDRDQEDCSGAALLTGTGPTWTVPAELIQAFFDNADLAETVLGGALSEDTVEAIRTEVGVPLLIDVTVHADGRELRATKRVLLSESATPHSNPPAPELRYGKLEVHPDPEHAWACTSDEPLTARAGAKIELAPATVDDKEAWLETYRVINARGEVEERTERAFYSWYATAGSFESHLTRAPLRNQVWTAPQKSGRNRLWLVVRDGHGGASACGFDVRVGR